MAHLLFIGDLQVIQFQQLTPLEPRRLMSSAIEGIAYADLNQNGTRENGDYGLAGITVFVDANSNFQLDASEAKATTDSAGHYSISGLSAGNHIVRVLSPDRWEQTDPSTAIALTTTSPKDSISAHQFVVALSSRHGVRELRRIFSDPTSGLGNSADITEIRELFRSQSQSVIRVALSDAVDLLETMETLSTVEQVAWVSPDYVYNSNALEYSPNDVLIGAQYHHARLNDAAAWDITTANRSVIIAVVDDGVDWSHPDLQSNIWQNTDEISGNHIDDDGNGYVDDVRGWDVVDHDNNPGPDTLSQNHGTHVAGIAAASIDNLQGGAGVAPDATILPVRVIDPAKSFNSSVIAEAYAYAVNNGAKIVVSSYNTDDFANDPIYKASLQYMYDHGALHFNSAGNISFQDPARQGFEQSILVASTDQFDARSSTSNYGWGIDLSAPGSSILSTVPGNQYAYLSGTSMAAPAAAGVAALVWAEHPEYTRDQVAARVIGLTDPIDAINPGFAGKLGSGRVNSYRSLTGTLAPPKFRSGSIIGLPPANGIAYSSPTSFSIDIANVFNSATINNSANWQLRGAGADNAFGTGDDSAESITLSTQYAVGTNRLRFAVNSFLVTGQYEFRAVSGSSGLRDPFGQSLDGNGDGVGGDNFTYRFSVLPPAPSQIVTLSANQTVGNINFGLFDHSPLQVKSVEFQFQVSQQLTIGFDTDVVGSIDASDLLLRNLTTGAVVNTGAFAVQLDSTGRYATITLASQTPYLPDGRYLITVKKAGVHDAFGNTPLDDASFGFFILAADANRDALVDSIDFNIVTSNYGQRDQVFSNGDFDLNRIVDSRDFNILAGNYGKSLPSVLP